MSVAIINYGLGNLKSVCNAIEFIDGAPFIAEEPKDLKKAAHIILPGVGAFGEGMGILSTSGWVDEIKEHTTEKQRPFLGICLGMQLLATKGWENGENNGLNLIPGEVKKLDTKSDSHRIPHIGWNEVAINHGMKTYDDFEDDHDFYFVHSYVFDVKDQTAISGTCSHGQRFVASVEKDNVWGTQFHPEKSQKPGLQILKNFLTL